jgi:hypothetical protein
MTASAGGVPSFVSVVMVPNYFPSVSKILGIQLTTSGGTPSTSVYAFPTQPANIALLTNGFTLSLVGNGSLDTSVYTIYWTNLVGYSPYTSTLDVKPC